MLPALSSPPARALPVALAALLALAPVAEAHAVLEEATPPPGSRVETAPEALVLRFSEELAPEGVTVRVTGPDGQRVDEGLQVDGAQVTVGLRPLEPALYQVEWRVLAEDGDVTTGGYRLAVGVAVDGTGSAYEQAHLGHGGIIVRGGAYAGAALALGLPLFFLCIGPRALPGFRSRALELVPVGAALAGALAAGLELQAIAVESGAGLAGSLRTAPGLATAARVALLLAAGALLLRAAAQPTAASRDRAWRWSLGPAAAALLAMSLSSHAAARGDGRALAVAADWLHLLALSAWLGGTLALVGLVWSRRPPRELSAAVRGFSPLAAACVLALLATGVYASLRFLSSPADLMVTRYGQALLSKLVLFGALIGLGAFNRLVVGPRVLRSPRALAGLELAAAAEVFLMTLAILLAAVLTGTSPPTPRG